MKSIACYLCFLPLLSFAQMPTGDACKKSLRDLDGQKTLMLSEKMPKYKSGDGDVLMEISKLIKYPQDQKNIQPRVDVGFVVDTLGHVRNACLIKRFSSTEITPIETEVLRAINSLKGWTPGEQNGKKVAVQYFIPIIIDLKK